MQTSRSFRSGMNIVGWAWAIGGTVIILITCLRGVIGWGSQHWPHVTGHVAQSDIVPVEKASGATAYYKVKLVYIYSPLSSPGSLFRSDRLSYHGFLDPADDSYTLAGARHLMRRYPVGSPVEVYYKPGDPRYSVLQPGTDVATFGGVWIGLAPLVLGMIISRCHLTRRRLSTEMSSSTAGQ